MDASSEATNDKQFLMSLEKSRSTTSLYPRLSFADQRKRRTFEENPFKSLSPQD